MRKILSITILFWIMSAGYRSPGSITISGTIKDASTSQPLAGATVAIKGTTQSTVTDSKGNFSLYSSSEKGIVIISIVGYTSAEYKFEKDSRPFNISLVPVQASMKEVVVIGYGTQNKKSVTGSVGKVRMEGERSGYLGPTLQGRVPGVSVNGKPAPYKYYPKHDRNIQRDEFNTEEYDGIVENRFLTSNENPLSTFSIDVDAAAYSNARRMLQMGQMPPAGAVRIEEFVNYFNYDYPQPVGENPFSINTEISDCPWNTKHKLVMIGLQGKKIPVVNLPSSNLTFLIDVSGSMMDENKLPLVKTSMKLLVDQLREKDRVAIVVYAGAAGMVLPSTSGSDKMTIKDAIDNLQAGGSTAGGAGIQLAYKVAKDNFLKGGNNRVILCTDGDFNVGASSSDALERMIEEERKSGVFLTVLGYGMGNYKDARMQKLADKGNGNHAYIDNFSEAKKVLVNEFGGTLFTIAKDVKLQIEFNPHNVQAYRLVGYENRLLNKEDFNNDKKDAGDLGSGHTVTAFYEIIPVGVKNEFLDSVDKLKYQVTVRPNTSNKTSEMMTIKFRYKKPDEDVSKLIEHAVLDNGVKLERTSENFRFASAVAEFGMVLRNSEFKQESSYDKAIRRARTAIGKDEEGYRAEFVKLVRNARTIAGIKEVDDEELSKK